MAMYATGVSTEIQKTLHVSCVAALLISALVYSQPGQAAPSSSRPLGNLIMPVSAVMHAELDLIPDAEQALRQSINYRNNGQLGEARVTALHGLYLARTDSGTYQQLLDEIDFELPVIQIKEWMLGGKTDQAEEALRILAVRYQEDSEHRARLETLQGSLASARQLRLMQKTNERTVIDAVRMVMRSYYTEHKSYPPSYRVLNRLLPPGDKILQNYEVIYFRSGRERGYQLVLRNKDNHESLLTITAPGLIK